MRACTSLTQKVTYTTRAKTITRVLADLTKATRVRMECNGDLDKEPLILKLNGVPLKEAMDKIAEVCAGEWVKKDNALILQRSAAADAIHAAAVKERTDEYQRGLQTSLAAWQIKILHSTSKLPNRSCKVGRTHTKARCAMTRLTRLKRHTDWPPRS